MATTIGCTILEAQQRISIKEFEVWIKYRQKYGPMNPVRRYDVGPAVVASMVARANGQRISALDLIQYGKEPEIEEEVDEGAFIAALSGKAKYGR